MSIFGTILEKLGMKKAHAATVDQAKAATTDATPASEPAAETPASTTSSSTEHAIPVTDVVGQLETKAAANPQKLNWKTSIVDLLKLLDLDSSLSARKELAAELNCPAEYMNDSAQMNMWLHKEVLKRLAQNGGNIPAELVQ